MNDNTNPKKKPTCREETVSVPHLTPSPIAGLDPVVALRNVDTNTIHRLGMAPRVSLGSGVDADVSVSDIYVSKHHCLLLRGPRGRLTVRDLESKNGVFIDRNRVHEGDLRAGSELRVGRTTFAALSARAFRRKRIEDQLIGHHPGFLDALEMAKRVARHGTPGCSVLILGETGTGKELIAKLIHESGPRRDAPFITLNCGGLTSSLIASELFGHTRGAFTDAKDDHIGVFEQAHRGTLFLDELGELPLEQQPHLLRAIESGEIRALGSSDVSNVDVHFIAATNRLDLATSDNLRSDLYHRVATVVIPLPPLRERRCDIPLLVETFVREITDEPVAVPPETMRALELYGWPGNIRELRHAVRRAVTLSRDNLDLAAFLPNISERRPPERPRRRDTITSHYDNGVRGVLEAALSQYGSVRRAARALGIPKSTFADRARRHGIKLA